MFYSYFLLDFLFFFLLFLLLFGVLITVRGFGLSFVFFVISDAIEQSQPSLNNPWFLWVAFIYFVFLFSELFLFLFLILFIVF